MSKRVTDEQLVRRCKADLRRLGLPTDFTLVLKDYSKRYYGRYDVDKKEVIIYIYRDEELTCRFTYKELMDTVIHEAIHHFQYCYQHGFLRLVGVMHDPVFKKMYTNNYKEFLNMYTEVNDEKIKISRRAKYVTNVAN